MHTKLVEACEQGLRLARRCSNSSTPGMHSFAHYKASSHTPAGQMQTSSITKLPTIYDAHPLPSNGCQNQRNPEFSPIIECEKQKVVQVSDRLLVALQLPEHPWFSHSWTKVRPSQFYILDDNPAYGFSSAPLENKGILGNTCYINMNTFYRRESKWCLYLSATPIVNKSN